MATDSRTAHRNLPKPHPDNLISEDFPRLIDLADLIDADLHQLHTGLATRAAAGHGHAIAEIDGLQNTLDSLAANSGGAETLNELTDVTTNGATNFQVLGFVGGSWQPWTVQAQYIAGLQALLDSKSDTGHTHDAAAITTGTIENARLPTTQTGKTFTGTVFINSGYLQVNGPAAGAHAIYGYAGGTNLGGLIGYALNTAILGIVGFGNFAFYGQGDGYFSGNVGVGTSSPSEKLHVNGNILATGDISAFSDERLKKDWSDLGPDFIEKFAEVKAGTYTRIDTDKRQVGVSAQDLQPVIPEAVHVVDDGTLTVSYAQAALAAAVALSRRVVELEARITELESA